MNASRFLRNVQLGIKSLLLHKLRSFLTILGVVFGVASVVAMLSVGEGASREALRQIKKLGSENLILRSLKPTEEEKEQSRSSGRSSVLDYGLTYDDLARIETCYPAVANIAPAKIIRETARLGPRAREVRLVGTTPDWFKLVPRDIIAGRVLTPADMEQHASVCVLAERSARDLLAQRHTLGQSLRIGEDAYVVVGIIRTESGAGGSSVQTPDQSIDAYVPLNVVRERHGDTVTQRSSGSFSRERIELHQIIVKVGPTQRLVPTTGILASIAQSLWGEKTRTIRAIDNVEPVAQAIRAGLERFHKRQDYSVSVPLALLRQARETQRIFNIVLGSIAGISLLVGGIGIMNIMLASVTERTREIGVRRAIGAKRRQIIRQFLIETVVLSTVGGIIGIAVGFLVPFLITHFAGMPTIVTPASLILALGISMATGIVFGLYPAARAAKLDPIIALRHE